MNRALILALAFASTLATPAAADLMIVQTGAEASVVEDGKNTTPDACKPVVIDLFDDAGKWIGMRITFSCLSPSD